MCSSLTSHELSIWLHLESLPRPLSCTEFDPGEAGRSCGELAVALWCMYKDTDNGLVSVSRVAERVNIGCGIVIAVSRNAEGCQMDDASELRGSGSYEEVSFASDSAS